MKNSITIRIGATQNSITTEDGTVLTIPEKANDRSVVAKAICEHVGIKAR